MKKKVLLVALLATAIIALTTAMISPVVPVAEAKGEGIYMTAETIIIFDNGTRVKIGPITVPCRIVEVTDRGNVIEPIFPDNFPEEYTVEIAPSDPDPSRLIETMVHSSVILERIKDV